MLIGTGASASSQLSAIQTVTAKNSSGPKGDDEFDMFAQARNATYENTKTRYIKLIVLIIQSHYS